MKNHFFVFIVIAISISLFSCNQEYKNSGKSDQITFNIDSTLISGKVVLKQFGLSVHPPKNWIKLDSSGFDKFSKGYKLQKSFIKPLNVFVDEVTQSNLIISEIKLDGQSFPDYMNSLQKIMEEMNSESKVMKSDFLLNNLSVVQFIIQNQNFINFKLITSINNKIMQLDYYIPPNFYNKMTAKTIESSIGTINITQQKSF